MTSIPDCTLPQSYSTNSFNQKIIFLDIDGVLNSYGILTDSLKTFARKFKMERLLSFLNSKYSFSGVEERRVRFLARIVHKTGAKVVLSTSRRGGWYRDINIKNESDRQIQLLFEKYKIEVIDIIPTLSNRSRQEEIAAWISSNWCIKNFVVLDDEDVRISNIIRTSKAKSIEGRSWENTGLKRRHINKAIKLLNGGFYISK